MTDTFTKHAATAKPPNTAPPWRQGVVSAAFEHACAQHDWQQLIGARNTYINLPSSGKQAIDRLCEHNPTAAALMAALQAARHAR